MPLIHTPCQNLHLPVKLKHYSLRGKNSFATFVNRLSGLKLFQLSNVDFTFFVTYLQHLQTQCLVHISRVPNKGHGVRT